MPLPSFLELAMFLLRFFSCQQMVTVAAACLVVIIDDNINMFVAAVRVLAETAFASNPALGIRQTLLLCSVNIFLGFAQFKIGDFAVMHCARGFLVVCLIQFVDNQLIRVKRVTLYFGLHLVVL